MIGWILAAMAAFFVKGLCGFANTLVFTSILSFQNSNANISPVELLLGYPTNMIIAFRERKNIKWSICLPLAAFVLVGMLPGIFFLKNADTNLVKFIFGIVIILLGAEMLISDYTGHHFRQSKIVTVIIGILSGVLCGLYGVGALLGAYLSKTTRDTSTFKANLCFVFFIENTMRIFLYTYSGIINIPILKQVLVLIPFMFIGLFLGMFSANRVNEKYIRKIVIIMLIVSGIALIWSL